MRNLDAMWIEINLDDFAFNYRQIQKMAGTKKLMPVIKADAYGHGAIIVAKALLEEGAECFAVATAVEAHLLRDAGIDTTLLVLGVVPSDCVDALVQRDVILAVPNMETALRYLASSKKRPIKIHIEVNTGMNRLGFSPKTEVDQLLAIASDPGFSLQGLFTHFADSGEPSHDYYTHAQHKIFKEVIEVFASKGHRPKYVHCANSDAIVRFPDFTGNLARPGIMLYGYPSPSPNCLPMRPPASVRARISQLKWLEAGESLSYGMTWSTRRRTLVATVAAGYADGILRTGSGKIEMLLRGKRVPQVGRICMDMCMLDVTDVPNVSIDDIVTIAGEDGGESLWMDELAKAYGTISYELLTSLSSRSSRYYLKGGKIVSMMRRVSDYSRP